MVSLQVKRTLVKSHPELWAELSDPASLARHLEAFEELRITRVDPESTIEWEARGASGTVAIKPSGWGTQVELSVTRELPAGPAAPEEAPAAEAAPAADGPALAQADPLQEPALPSQEEHMEDVLAAQVEEEAAEPLLEERVDEEEAAPEPVAEEPAGGEDGHEAEQHDAPVRRRQLFKRLFARMRSRRPGPADPAPPEEPQAIDEVAPPIDESSVSEPPVVADETTAVENSIAMEEPVVAEEPATTEDSVMAEEPVVTEGPVVIAEARAVEASDDVVQELAALEQRLADETTAVLASVLDRLGAAHHRPFSRS